MLYWHLSVILFTPISKVRVSSCLLDFNPPTLTFISPLVRKIIITNLKYMSLYVVASIKDKVAQTIS